MIGSSLSSQVGIVGSVPLGSGGDVGAVVGDVPLLFSVGASVMIGSSSGSVLLGASPLDPLPSFALCAGEPPDCEPSAPPPVTSVGSVAVPEDELPPDAPSEGDVPLGKASAAPSGSSVGVSIPLGSISFGSVGVQPAKQESTSSITRAMGISRFIIIVISK